MRLLFVDAGNYCRSPAAEAAMRAKLEARGLIGRVSVGSAGLKDKHVGDTADPRAVAACMARGLTLVDFRCRQIADPDFRQSDLILAMDSATRDALLARRPAGVTADITLFMEAAGGGDIPDPYYGGGDGFAAMMDLIDRGAAALTDRIASDLHPES